MPRGTVKVPAELLTEVNKQLRALHDLIPELDKAENCGVDCTERRHQVEKLRQQLEQVKASYGK